MTEVSSININYDANAQQTSFSAISKQVNCTNFIPNAGGMCEVHINANGDETSIDIYISDSPGKKRKYNAPADAPILKGTHEFIQRAKYVNRDITGFIKEKLTGHDRIDPKRAKKITRRVNFETPVGKQSTGGSGVYFPGRGPAQIDGINFMFSIVKNKN